MCYFPYGMAQFSPPALLLDSCEDGECAQSRGAATRFAALDQRAAQTLEETLSQKLFQHSEFAEAESRLVRFHAELPGRGA